MPSILHSFSIVIILAIVILLGMTYLGQKGSRQLVIFRWLLFWIVLWLLSNFALDFGDHHLITLYILRATFLTSILMVYMLYRLSLAFPNTLEVFAPWQDYIVKVTTAIAGVLSISPLLVADYSRSGAMVLARYAGGYYIYAAYIFMLLAVVVFNFIKQYRISPALKRQQSKYLFVGLIISTTIITTVDLVIPLVLQNNTASNFGPFGIIVWVVCSYLALTRQHLFQIKVLLSEFWAILLITVIFIWLSTHYSLGNLMVFLVIISICVLFIRSVISEARKEEQLEHANRQLEEDKKRLVELDKLKDDFISMASHELNTPISAIKGYLSMVLVEGLGGEIPDKARQYLETVFQASRRLSDMVSDLLNVSRIESGRIHLIWERKQIEEVIQQAITEVASKAREAHHTLTYEAPKQKMPLTWFDTNRITEVLINLLGNAIKYTPNGGKVAVSIGYSADDIVVSVKDDGKGIPKDKADRVFKKFSQVDVVKDEHKGTGLGMYISQKFIELHKGKIWFESKGEGKGTTFHFSLPILTAKPYDPYEGESAVLSQ